MSENTSKPSNATRQSLLEHGLQLVAEKGLRGLTVRELASRAEVNLGSFVYHFGTREKFIAELVELWYAPLYEQIKHTALDEPQTSAIARLEATLALLIGLIGQNANFVRHILADAVAGETAAHSFLFSLRERHPKLLIELVMQAQRDGSLIAEPPLHLLLFIMTAVQTPVIASAGPLKDAEWLPMPAKFMLHVLSAPEAAHKRLQWALKGVKT